MNELSRQSGSNEIIVPPMSATGTRLYRGLHRLLRAVARIWVRLDIEGVENVPSGGFVVAPGAHRSILDTPLVAISVPNVLRFMGAEKYFEIPGVGAFLRSVGGFPVERDMTDREALRISEAILTSGQPIVVFPEATRYSGDTVHELKEGAVFLAARAQVPILPIGIGGAERSLGIGKYLPRPTRIHIVIGPPIASPPKDANGRVKRSVIKAQTARLHDELQSLFDQAQAKAGLGQN